VSRSYCKIPSYDREILREGSFRSRNRRRIHEETRNPEYGEVIFPVHKECYFFFCCKNNSLKKETRDKYFLEIRNILNGYASGNEEPYDEAFLESYAKIKGLIPDDGRKYGFEWLNVRKIRKIIKNWTGEPIEALKYLAHHGFIEKAVQRRFKLDTKK